MSSHLIDMDDDDGALCMVLVCGADKRVVFFSIDSPHVCLQAQRFIVDHLWSCRVKKTPNGCSVFSLHKPDVDFIGFTDLFFCSTHWWCCAASESHTGLDP